MWYELCLMYIHGRIAIELSYENVDCINPRFLLLKIY